MAAAEAGAGAAAAIMPVDDHISVPAMDVVVHESGGDSKILLPPLPWNGVVEKTISAPLEKVWDVASDFLGFPNVLTIEAVAGENRVAGCTRKVTNLPGGTDLEAAQWAKQKLVEINPAEHAFSYEFLENNTGVDPGYYSTFQARQEEGGKTVVRWAFRFSPSQAGSDHFVPIILKGTDLYVQELEKLAKTAPVAQCVLV